MSQLLSQGNKPIEAMQILKLLLDNDPKSIPIVTWYYWRQYFIRNDLHPFVHGTSAELIPAELKERVSASSRIMFSSFRSLADVVFMVMQGFIRTNDDVYATKVRRGAQIRLLADKRTHSFHLVHRECSSI
jgi:hypothetical protein